MPGFRLIRAGLVISPLKNVGCVKEWFLAGLCHFSVLLHTLGGNVSISPRSNVSRFGKTTARLLRQSGRWANPRQVKAESLCLLLQLSYTFEFFFFQIRKSQKARVQVLSRRVPFSRYRGASSRAAAGVQTAWVFDARGPRATAPVPSARGALLPPGGECSRAPRRLWVSLGYSLSSAAEPS